MTSVVSPIYYHEKQNQQMLNIPRFLSCNSQNHRQVSAQKQDAVTFELFAQLLLNILPAFTLAEISCHF